MDLSLLFPLLILLLFIPIFLSGRRQRRQVAQTQALQQSLENGDVVVTTSGLRGTVIDASYEDTIDLEIADGVVTTWLRAAIRDGLPAFGTCAGMIMLADHIEGGIVGQETIGGLDVVVRRNAFGRQVDSFE